MESAMQGDIVSSRENLTGGSESKPSGSAARSPGEIWLDGNVILCACPDCRAPVSVRLWLMMAECWQCGASIELSEAQERQVEQLLAERQAPSAVPSRPTPTRPQARPNPVPETPGAGSLPPDVAVPAREPWSRHLLNEIPAWLISMLAHLILLTLLALLTMTDEPSEGPFITLSAVLNRRPTEGGDIRQVRYEETAEFDLPLPTKANLDDDRELKSLRAAAEDARQLRLDENVPHLPDLRTVKSRVGRADGLELALAARDPRLRVEVVSQEGGTTLTEAAVARGLKWLANHQSPDGSWSLVGFRHAADCNCSGDGSVRSKAAGTALALLPFLGAGQTHLAGRYKGTVARGLRWTIDNQLRDGDLRGGNGSEGMYAHGVAAIVLCEAFAMTGDEALRVPAQKAINFIASAQYHDGGWRYRPGPKNERGDTSVVGWQLMALQSARAASLTVPDETWEMADVFLDGVQHQGGALYAYQTRNDPTPAMTAEALLCRMYLGWTKDRPALVRGVRWLSENHRPSALDTNIYYWYYATQVMHHYGGPEWERWNLRMRDILVSMQETRGHLAGSWRPKGDYSDEGGRIYMTSLAVCTLEVYYRHLPIYRRIELE